MTTTTMGQLVSDLYAKYERTFHDATLAALATQAEIEAILRDTRCGDRSHLTSVVRATLR